MYVVILLVVTSLELPPFSVIDIPLLLQDLSDPRPQPRESHLEDAQLARAVSLSLKVSFLLLLYFS